jgi:glucose/mannose transport system substrate-binding protein
MKSVVAAGIGLVTLALLSGTAVAPPQTTRLSQWDSGSDAAAIAKLGDMFKAAGGEWQATSIAGHTANTLAKLRADVVAGNPPPAVQLKGPEIKEWNETGMTANLDDLANKEGWDKVVAPELLPVMKPTGNWVAVPMNIHRINWTWASAKVMKQLGITEMPKTRAEFNADCDKAEAAGLNCIAHLSQDWTDATTMENIVYGMDLDLDRKAFVEGDIDALKSPGMIKAFDQLRLMVSKYMDPGIAGRDYDTASNMMAQGKALFFIMGDWEVGTLNAAGYKYGMDNDYVCAQSPTDWGKPGFILNSDSVVLFKQNDPDYAAGGTLLAHLIMSKDFQAIFNKAKGSIPARLDVPLTDSGWNPCQVQSQKDLQASIKEGTLVRSMAHNMTVLQKFRGAMMDTITQFVNTPSMSSEDAANAMSDAVAAQQ